MPIPNHIEPTLPEQVEAFDTVTAEPYPVVIHHPAPTCPHGVEYGGEEVCHECHDWEW